MPTHLFFRSTNTVPRNTLSSFEHESVWLFLCHWFSNFRASLFFEQKLDEASKFLEEAIPVAAFNHGDGDILGGHVRHEDPVLVVLNLRAPKIWWVPLAILVNLLGLVLRVGFHDLRRRHRELLLAELLQGNLWLPPEELLVLGGVVAAARLCRQCIVVVFGVIVAWIVVWNRSSWFLKLPMPKIKQELNIYPCSLN